MSGAGAPTGSAADAPREDLCLITGASGFIGGRLTERLVQDGHAVRCLVRPSSDTTALESLDVEIVIGDLTDARSLARAAGGCSHVVHCGALVSDWATKNEIKKINVDGTRLMLEAAADAGVRRFVHLSTTDVYGYPGGHAIDESYRARRFRNWYAQTKLEAEAEVRRSERERALEAVILRPATVYGPGSIEVVGEIARAIRSRNMLLIGRGRAVAGLCYVNNLIDAVLLALSSDAAAGQAFNVTDALDVTWRQFTGDLAAGLASPPVRWSMPYQLALAIGFALEHGYRIARRATRLTAPALLSRQAVHVLGCNQDFSNHKARETLLWEPRVGYREGLDATLAWLQSE
ncbi:MAG TPA: NAD-dependent epimerase/dehydratase family protein [Solirubrobacteraceae bacterium]|nr:NAD-dependent epimerase/dehydratase family protein [Solirubrobacteraceae bacterium]